MNWNQNWNQNQGGQGNQTQGPKNKDGTGALFQNAKKQQPNHPDVQGTFTLNGVDYEISGWNKTSKKNGMPFISLSVRPKGQRPQQQGNQPPQGQQGFGFGGQPQGNQYQGNQGQQAWNGPPPGQGHPQQQQTWGQQPPQTQPNWNGPGNQGNQGNQGTGNQGGGPGDNIPW